MIIGLMMAPSVLIYWTLIIFIKVLTYVQKTWGKMQEMCNRFLSFIIDFIMSGFYSSFDFDCSLL